MMTAPAGSTVVIPAGDHQIGDCVINGLLRAGVVVQSQYPPGGPVSRLIGMLECRDCNGWLFDGIHVLGDAPSPTDPAYTVRMRRGDGWRWTQCDISNGVDPGGERYGVRGVFTTIDQVLNWQIDNCAVHSNGSSVPGDPNNNLDHLIYLNAFPTTVSSNGLVGPNNVFHGNSWGAPVKVGFGLKEGVPIGIRGVTVISNHLYSNISPDGNCGVLVAGSSPETRVVGNQIDCTGEPTSWTTTPITIRDWIFGDTVAVENNIVTGAHNAGVPTGCDMVPPFGTDLTVTVGSQLPLLGDWQVSPNGCFFHGVSTSGNVTTPT